MRPWGGKIARIDVCALGTRASLPSVLANGRGPAMTRGPVDGTRAWVE